MVLPLLFFFMFPEDTELHQMLLCGVSILKGHDQDNLVEGISAYDYVVTCLFSLRQTTKLVFRFPFQRSYHPINHL